MAQINRRQVLITGIAAAAAANTSFPAEAQPSTADPFLVRAGDARPGGTATIFGEKAFTTKVSATDTTRKYAIIEVHTPPGYGPELHTHISQNEVFYVLKGSIGMQCGTSHLILKAGDTYMVPTNTSHAYVTLGSEPASMLNVFEPAGDIETFFQEYAAIIGEGGPPDQQKMQQVYARHGMTVLGPPLSAAAFTS